MGRPVSRDLGDALAFLFCAIVTTVACCPSSADAGPLTYEVVTEAPEWYAPSNPPKPDGCEFSERFDNHGRRMVEAPAECLDWLFLRAEEANESARQLLALRQWVEIVVPALDGQASARGDALRIARRGKARDLFGTNLTTNVGSLFMGGAVGYGVCSANN